MLRNADRLFVLGYFGLVILTLFLFDHSLDCSRDIWEIVACAAHFRGYKFLSQIMNFDFSLLQFSWMVFLSGSSLTCSENLRISSCICLKSAWLNFIYLVRLLLLYLLLSCFLSLSNFPIIFLLLLSCLFFFFFLSFFFFFFFFFFLGGGGGGGYQRRPDQWGDMWPPPPPPTPPPPPPQRRSRWSSTALFGIIILTKVWSCRLRYRSKTLSPSGWILQVLCSCTVLHKTCMHKNIPCVRSLAYSLW